MKKSKRKKLPAKKQSSLQKPPEKTEKLSLAQIEGKFDKTILPTLIELYEPTGVADIEKRVKAFNDYVKSQCVRGYITIAEMNRYLKRF